MLTQAPSCSQPCRGRSPQTQDSWNLGGPCAQVRCIDNRVCYPITARTASTFDMMSVRTKPSLTRVHLVVTEMCHSSFQLCTFQTLLSSAPCMTWAGTAAHSPTWCPCSPLSGHNREVGQAPELVGGPGGHSHTGSPVNKGIADHNRTCLEAKFSGFAAEFPLSPGFLHLVFIHRLFRPFFLIPPP